MSPLLAVEGLWLEHAGREILRGVQLKVEPGQVCALMGLSGAGKSSVLRAVAALQRFNGGSITVDGFGLTPGAVPPESRLRPLRRKVGLVFQSHALFDHLTARENVSLALVHVLGLPPEAAGRRARDLLDSLGVGARAEAYPNDISGGEAQRVAIARALALEPALLLMDEPTAALDPARRGALGATLRQLAGEHRGLLVATHDVEFARGCADRAAILAQGTVVEEGPATAVLDAPRHEATRTLLEFGVRGGAGRPTA